MSDKEEDLVEKTRSAVRRMSDLLEEPHPGLFSWANMLNNAFDDLAKFFAPPKDRAQTQTAALNVVRCAQGVRAAEHNLQIAKQDLNRAIEEFERSL